MSGLNESLWEFPCNVNVKAMGLSHHPVKQIMLDLALQHCEAVDQSSLQVKPSRTGKYHSVTLTVTAKDRSQIEQLYLDLAAKEEIVWTL